MQVIARVNPVGCLGLNIGNVMLLLSHFWFCSISLSFPLSVALSPSLSPCQSADLWLCLSEGHTSLPTLLFVSTPLHFSTLPPLMATRNQQKINPWLLCTQQSVFCGSSQVVPASENLTGLHSDSTVVLTKG